MGWVRCAPVEFPPFEHAQLLGKAWRHGPPKHNLGGSGYYADTWLDRGLPPLDPAEADPMGLNLHAETHLRDRLASRFEHDPRGTLVTCGTTGANTTVLHAFIEPGCNVVIERPTYTPLANVAQALGAEVRYVDRGWGLDPDDVTQAVDSETALIILSSPNNPTATVATGDELRAFGEIAEDVDAHVLVDQVYRELTDHAVGAQMHSRVITTAGLNKCWGAPGLRIGWLLCDPALGPRLVDIHRSTHLAPPVASEVAAAVMLEHEALCRQELDKRLDENYPAWVQWCEERGLEHGPRGLVNFVDLNVRHEDALAAGVLILPGRVFGWESHARIGLGVSADAFGASLAALGAL